MVTPWSQISDNRASSAARAEVPTGAEIAATRTDGHIEAHPDTCSIGVDWRPPPSWLSCVRGFAATSGTFALMLRPVRVHTLYPSASTATWARHPSAFGSTTQSSSVPVGRPLEASIGGVNDNTAEMMPPVAVAQARPDRAILTRGQWHRASA